MLVVMSNTATAGDVDRVCETIRAMGYTPVVMPGASRTNVRAMAPKTRAAPRAAMGNVGLSPPWWPALTRSDHAVGAYESA